MKVYIKETVDYTLKRKGDHMFTIVDETCHEIGWSGCWKTKAACKARLAELDEQSRREYPNLGGYECIGTIVHHQNYEHWADFELNV